MAAPKRGPNMHSIRRRQMLKKRLKLQESKDDISMNSTSSATIAGSMASALSVGMVTVADPKTSSSELRYVGLVFII